MPDFDVTHLAGLARINLTDEEQELFASQLGDVLGYVNKLQELSTEGVPETSQVTGLVDVLRDNPSREPEEDLANLRTRRGELLAAAATQRDGYIQVPAIFSEE